ncbi:hypothetical protein LP419_12495 [Massilia sp. H-1]|nr:hypothetical protein LP419_12495 [Massilia sp. H-1]
MGVVGVNPNGQLKLHFVKVFGAQAWAYSSTLASAANQCGGSKRQCDQHVAGRGARQQDRTKGLRRTGRPGHPQHRGRSSNDGNSTISYPG